MGRRVGRDYRRVRTISALDHSMCFAVEDLFVVGIGFEVAGAFLLGRGLLTSAEEIARRTASYLGYSSPLAVSQIKDRVDGAFGLGALFLGFLTQAVAYVVTLSRGTSGDGSGARAVTAITLALLAVVLVLVLWQAVRPRLLKRGAIKVARVNVFKLPVEIKERPYGALLLNYGKELGFDRLDTDNERTYAERVFGVTEIEPGGMTSDETPRLAGDGRSP
jgi:hypothetical protein